MKTAERVSRDVSDNFVFARSVLAYREAAKIVRGQVLEIGTGSGYGVEIVAPKTEKFVTVDKHNFHADSENVEFKRSKVPPLDFADRTFDFVISFQVIEHIQNDKKMLDEVWRVLRPGGKLIISTPNAKMSLTRNPWHVREYTAQEFSALLQARFGNVEALGVFGNRRVMEYYEHNKEAVEKITKLDPLRLQYLLPRWMLKVPYDILNRLNRRRLLARNQELTTSIAPEDYRLAPATGEAFDLFYIATKI